MKGVLRILALAIVNLSFACGSAQAVELGTPFSDGAVLQRGTNVPVWGRATPGNVVTVSFAGQERTAKTGADGSWRVVLSPMDASRDGRTLVATEAVPGWLFDTTVDVSEAKDVLVGEVWFASGQSNMNCPVWGGNPRFRQGNGAVLRFDNVRSWYVYSPDRSHSAPFELAGADGVWRPARIANFARRDDRKTGKPTEAYELAGPEVVLSCNGMRERPVKVRYMGAPRTSGTLYNEMSLPLGPFDSAAVVALRKNELRTND